MAVLHRLSPADLKRSEPGMYGDGAGLWLQITRSPAGHANRSWVFRFALDGRRREMGVGAVHIVGLKDAREKAAALRRAVFEGTDPIARRDAERAARTIAVAKAMTFDQCASEYAKAHSATWSPKHSRQWTGSLSRLVSPTIGKLPVSDIDTALVVRTLERFWTKTPETATRVRQRIEAVLGWATVRELRTGDNPARWEGHLENLLPGRRKLDPGEHHAALPYAEVPAFMELIRQRDGSAARLIEFVVLTATRRGEAMGARWDEIEGNTWTIPASRMKAGVEHRVPLSPRAMAILENMRAVRRGDHVFPGVRSDAVAETPLRALLLNLSPNATLHGFRSSFRDWCRERTNFPREIAEAALAHTIKSQVERAYARGDVLEQRRRLMAAWADYCSKPMVGAAVTPIRRA